MKKALILILIVLCALSSLSAAREFITLAMSSSYNTASNNFGLGFFSQYQLGASITDKTSIGFGTYVDCDFALLPLAKDPNYITFLSVGIGPSASTEISDITTFTAILGPQVDCNTAKSDFYYPDRIGFGVGTTLALSLIPKSERQSKVQIGFTTGLNGFMTFLEDTKTPTFGARLFFGFSVIQPFFGVYYPDIYDAVIDSAYRY